MGLRQFLDASREDLPEQPGVYLFLDKGGNVIYVGKAKSIRKRVSSHASRSSVTGAWEMLAEVESVECVVTQTEAEALLAEQTFIKRHRPRFNIRLRDDKSYPYIGISLDERFPRVYFTRERHAANRIYFGPYSSAKKVRQTLDLLGRLFQYRTCDGPEPGRASGSPCLDYHIQRCQAPCDQTLTDREYREAIDGIIMFLQGRYRDIEEKLASQMGSAAAAQEFERAAVLRDRLRAVRSLVERQQVAASSLGTTDVIGVASKGGEANVQVFQVRDGVLADRMSFFMEQAAGRGDGEIVGEFLGQYYMDSSFVPPQILLPCRMDVSAPLREALVRRRHGRSVDARQAERGHGRRLVELACRNARLALGQDQMRRERRRRRRFEALTALAGALSMESVPVRIEAYDISNLGPTNTVASMVVFEYGVPKKADYRHFLIRRHGGPDDFASIEEVLRRRSERLLDAQGMSPHDPARDPSFTTMPQLVLIDGGRGQLSRGLAALGPLVEAGVSVVALAKRLEEVFVPGRSEPILLGSEAALHLLQSVRDEAHRFASQHHRRRRDAALTDSLLDSLRGVGPSRKRILLKHFGSPELVAAASRRELESVPGLPPGIGRAVHDQLHRAGG